MVNLTRQQIEWLQVVLHFERLRLLTTRRSLPAGLRRQETYLQSEIDACTEVLDALKSEA